MLPLHHGGLVQWVRVIAVKPRVSTALAPEERVDRSPSGSKPDVQAARLLGYINFQEDPIHQHPLHLHVACPLK